MLGTELLGICDGSFLGPRVAQSPCPCHQSMKSDLRVEPRLLFGFTRISGAAIRSLHVVYMRDLQLLLLITERFRAELIRNSPAELPLVREVLPVRAQAQRN